MPLARLAEHSDLDGLLALFHAGDVSATVEPLERAQAIWATLLDRAGAAVFVSEQDGKIVATALLVTVPNLLRGGRQHGFLENVVTHPDCRGKGHGRAVVSAALSEAWAADCHHVLMQSGRKDPRVHRFYERCGFEPGLRTAYVARRPE